MTLQVSLLHLPSIHSLSLSLILFQELFTINHHLLNAIGVGHSSLDKIHNIALKVGIASKLTGAGGGGCAIALIPPGKWATLNVVIVH